MIRLVVETLVRTAAVMLFIIGLGTAIFVLDQAKELYEQPESIEKFATRIEEATRLDKFLATILSGVLGQESQSTTDDDDDTADTAGGNTGSVATVEVIRISYFVSWILVILLLSLLIRVSLAMVHTGGVLVLHDLRQKRITSDEPQDK